MKNKIIITIFFLLINNILLAENILIESKNIFLDKNKNTSIFENEVIIKTDNNYTINSDFAEYNKSSKFLIIKKKIKAVDNKNNIIESEYAEYSETSKILKSLGETKITTPENYTIISQDVTANDDLKIIKSDKKTRMIDPDNNEIYLENFEYDANQNILKSVGRIIINDINENSYEFSQVYIDTKNKEILGTDIKAFLNDKSLKIDTNNKPRIFANTVSINKKTTSFNKSISTLCDYRENDKCPPWTIQSSKMLHDAQKKTIYYDNALLRVYNVPIFYFPKLSHPDPTVDRRSGFLPPNFSNSRNLGSSISIPYFWALNDDKNLTLNSRLLSSEHPLFTAEYHQVFKNSSLMADFGYTKGYKKTTAKKKSGDKSHFFSKFVKNFDNLIEGQSSLILNLQQVTGDKYLKLYKVNSELVEDTTEILENSLEYTYLNDDLFFGFNSSVFETLNENYNDKYEFILPEITLNKNIISDEKYGLVDLQTNYKIHNYDTNKLTNFLVNDLNWSSNKFYHATGFTSQIFGNFKNLNYETKNTDIYKEDTTSEIHGAIGYMSQLNFRKKTPNGLHLLKPKMLMRYSPGSMRKSNEAFLFNPTLAFNMSRLSNNNNFEKGLNTAIGIDYNLRKNQKKFDFSLAQIINQKENKKMASRTSLDEKLSDLVGKVSHNLNENFNLRYNFAIDQNLNQFNYNEMGVDYNFDPFNLNFNFLEESKHIGDQKYLGTKINYTKSNNGIFSFETKRNLVTDSSEFYNLSYEYINDCLRAGLVYRREFYEDSELEPENSLMFQITLSQFGSVSSPSLNK